MSSTEKQAQEMAKLANQTKWLRAFLLSVLVALLFNKYSFNLVNGVLRKLNMPATVGKDGPNVGGYLLHAVVFMLLARGLMRVDLASKLMAMRKLDAKKN